MFLQSGRSTPASRPNSFKVLRFSCWIFGRIKSFGEVSNVFVQPSLQLSSNFRFDLVQILPLLRVCNYVVKSISDILHIWELIILPPFFWCLCPASVPHGPVNVFPAPHLCYQIGGLEIHSQDHGVRWLGRGTR